MPAIIISRLPANFATEPAEPLLKALEEQNIKYTWLGKGEHRDDEGPNPSGVFKISLELDGDVDVFFAKPIDYGL